MRKFLHFFMMVLLCGSVSAAAAPAHHIPDKDADPLGLKDHQFSFRKENLPEVPQELNKQMEYLKRAHTYSEQAFNAENLRSAKFNARKARKYAKKIIPKELLPEVKDVIKAEDTAEPLREQVTKQDVLFAAQSVYIFNSLVLKANNPKKAQYYAKKAKKAAETLVYPKKNSILVVDSVKNFVNDVF